MNVLPISTPKRNDPSRGPFALAAIAPGQQCDLLQLPTRRARYKVLKSATDLLLASLLIPFAFVLGLGIALLIKLSSPGPIFFRHLRIGAGLRPFYLLKFRTMLHESDDCLSAHFALNPEAQREWELHRKLRHDPRVTLIGRFLRRTNLDELPQLLNVLAGEMSLVGPRPVVAEELRRFGAGQNLYGAVKPGLTGLWQVSGRAALPYERRVALDFEYVTTWSMLGDLQVLIRTFGAICNARGAY